MPIERFLQEAEKAGELLREGKRLFVHHRDADGTTAAALMMRFFPGEAVSLEYGNLEPGMLFSLKEKGPGLVVFLDLAIDRHPEEVEELGKACPVLVIDHHIMKRDLNSGRTLYMNPRMHEKGAYISASCLVYRLLERIGKPVQGQKWIAAMGAIGDHAEEGCSGVMEGLDRDRLAEAEKMVSSAISVRGEKGAGKVLGLLLEAGGPEDLEKDPQLVKWRKELDRELDTIVSGFREKGRHFPEKGVSILEVRSKYQINSLVSTVLSERNPDLVVITMRPEKGGHKLSLRNQSGRVDLSRAVGKACEGIGRGGGHEKAAGAWVSDLKEFLRRLMDGISSA